MALPWGSLVLRTHIGKNLKKKNILSETRRPRLLIFGVQLHLGGFT